jgi:hypothetical protein
MYENDSTDGTKAALRNWANQNELVAFESENVNSRTWENDLRGNDRKYWMALARNRYLEYARTYCERYRVNYIIIVDTDLQGGWSYHGILNSLGHNNWDVIGSNSLYYHTEKNKTMRLYYDSWAFRPLGHPEALSDVEANLFVWQRGEPMLQVNSAFGGLGVYHPHFLYEDVNYTAEDCDHPSLHNQLCEKGYHIFMNPSQITLYNNSEFVV